MPELARPATRTIKIDADAYQRLERARRDGESFSDTLKRVIWDPAAFLTALEATRADPLSDKAIAAIEQVVAARRTRSRRSR